VSSLAHRLGERAAVDVLEFGISRFELHIAPEHGDGEWAEWLQPPENISDALTGFIWSALGSPDSAERWQATHCVRRLVEFSCDQQLSSLLRWSQNGGVAAFGSDRFPFYGLHATLYLLIGLSRGAIENAAPLLPHANVFADIALTGVPHVLIQRAAAALALLLAKTSLEMYPSAVSENLRRVGHSPFPLHEVNDPDPTSISPTLLPAEDLVPDIYLAWDFDDYWFKNLANLFAVDRGKLIDSAKMIAVRDLGVRATDGYPRDGRKELWNSGSFGYWATSHDHGSYPHVDDYAFYYSHHAFFSIAARLLSSVPIIRRIGGYWEDHIDPWGEWLSRYWLTRSDGRWLADRRDPTPLKRRRWLKDRDEHDWLWRVTAEDFLDCIAVQTSLPNSLCVAGFWLDNDYSRVETIRVSSALVNHATSTALANAMRTREHAYSCKLPSYQESDAETTHAPFQLTGWIVEPDGSERRLDAFDPHAREVSYPPLGIGKTFESLLDLRCDYEKRHWRKAGGGDVLLKSETWSDEKTWRKGEREEPFRHGVRVCASIALLKQLCIMAEKDLIIEVQIARREERSYSKHENNYSYIEPSFKVFVLSPEGTLKDAGKSHQLG
jgi:hypothetical protein